VTAVSRDPQALTGRRYKSATEKKLKLSGLM
jgi:hypothetical protein